MSIVNKSNGKILALAKTLEVPSNTEPSALQQERAATRLRIDIDTVHGTLFSRFTKNFLYFWIVLLIILGLVVLSSGVYLLHYQVSSRILPSFTYKAASYAGAILVVLSVIGLYGLHQQRMCVTLGKRNYALASFVILGIGGTVIVALAGSIAILLCEIARDAKSSAFRFRSVRSFEVALVRMLLIYAFKHPSNWNNAQDSMDCCGYASLHLYIQSGSLPQLESDSESLTQYDFLNGSEYYGPFLQSVMLINNVTGRACASQSAYCESSVTFGDIPCPKSKRNWCRTTVLQGAKSNYNYIGFIAVILGCAQVKVL
uniref:Transmembrane protein putative n=1 Tax=Albugo laibachii Nc14 TaxID=890382 RepID=F0WTC7_9STRA|nr:transmembrane protein putative [Albugo laibachii Nc14]|eukprot:CCA24617.1 transmembrane protein putative [Albugo laibachii Nc14]